MARTIDQIKKDMTANFVRQRAVVSAYGINPDKGFDEQFSKASIESVLFYVFAVAVWSLEKLFDLHRKEVDSYIEQLEPHTLRWYVNKAKGFMLYDKLNLVPGTDRYDTSKMTEQEIEDAHIVKYAVATESNTVVYIKVARKNDEGNPVPLASFQMKALEAYMDEVKDAGVAIVLRNDPADKIKISLNVFYDPTILKETGELITGESERFPVKDAVNKVITELPFNGVYRNSDLLAAVQSVPGVKVADIEKVETAPDTSEDYNPVVGYHRPHSGYYTIKELNVNYEQYELYE